MVGPLATNCEFNSHAELTYMKVIKSSVISFANELPPLVACEVGRGNWARMCVEFWRLRNSSQVWQDEPFK